MSYFQDGSEIEVDRFDSIFEGLDERTKTLVWYAIRRAVVKSPDKNKDGLLYALESTRIKLGIESKVRV